MDLGTILLVAILLACPLMMLLMHRGGHKRAGAPSEPDSLDELRRRREELDSEITAREEAQRPRGPERVSHR